MDEKRESGDGGGFYRSSLCPSFLRILSSPEIRTVMVVGCGGGFDFVHSMLLYPELRSVMKKRVVIGSFSFGSTRSIKLEVEEIEVEGLSKGAAKKVNATSEGPVDYCPEVGLCHHLDESFPQDAPHYVYAFSAREYTVPTLTTLYNKLIERENVDCVIIFDGGSDSLMRGNETGLGDPVEDSVSVTTVAHLKGPEGRPLKKILVSVGFGADRYNGVSDASSLRAVAELTGLGGSLGCLMVEKNSFGAENYRRAIARIYKDYKFRSVLAGMILASLQGSFGDDVPEGIDFGGRVKKGQSYCWPLMSFLFAFDAETVCRRSLMSNAIKDCVKPIDCQYAISDLRAQLRQNEQMMGEELLPQSRFWKPSNPVKLPAENSASQKDKKQTCMLS